MPCGHCGESGHNRRRCSKYNAEQIAKGIAGGMTKSAVYRLVDVACPGAGVSMELIDRAYGYYSTSQQLQSRTKNERERALIGLLVGEMS